MCVVAYRSLYQPMEKNSSSSDIFFPRTMEDRQVEGEYSSYLNRNDGSSIRQLILDKGYRLILNVDEMRKFIPNRVAALMSPPNQMKEQISIQRALVECVNQIGPAYARDNRDKLTFGFEGTFHKLMRPGELDASHLKCLVKVEGIVSKQDEPRVRILRHEEYCKALDKYRTKVFLNESSLEEFVPMPQYQFKSVDNNGNVWDQEDCNCVYQYVLVLVIQDLPQRIPAGSQLGSVEVIVHDDLVDVCRPGDIVHVYGNYKYTPHPMNVNRVEFAARTAIVANNICSVDDALSDIDVEDIREFKKLSEHADIMGVLANSLAPSIYGHELIKKAIICLLVGGTSMILPSGITLRGNIHVLLVGDPSCGKSQLLRCAMNASMRSVSTSGRSASAAGLTAAVIVDKATGARRVEAGATVLGDRGIVCIDEFDKMTDSDRASLHEVLEQGTCTITKAGVNMTLNARCSVLAAANPRIKNFVEVIDIQPPLLSRFDLIFYMRDTVDSDIDSLIANFVVGIHSQPQNATNSDQQKRYTVDKGKITLTPSFLSKYIRIASSIKPRLSKYKVGETSDMSKLVSPEMEKIAIHYAKSRERSSITARAVEATIRLATASAKIHASKLISDRDVDFAIEIHSSCFGGELPPFAEDVHMYDDGGDDGDIG